LTNSISLPAALQCCLSSVSDTAKIHLIKNQFIYRYIWERFLE